MTIKEWWTARELAIAALPGLPNTRQGVQAMIDREGWREQPSLCRVRPASGGGWEYHRDLFPPSAQHELTRRAQAEAGQRALVAARAAAIVPVPVATLPALPVASQIRVAGGGLQRLDGKAATLVAYDAWRLNHAGLSDRAARHLFVGAWNAGQITRPAGPAPAHLSEPSLRRWLDARAKGDLAALSGRYGNRAGTGLWDGPLQAVRDYVVGALIQLPDITSPAMMELVEREFGRDQAPSLRTLQKMMQQWRAENPSLLRRVSDPDGWKNRDMLALGDAGAGIERINQCWMIDASPQDVITIEGRYQIYALIDVYPRRLKVLVTKTARTEAVKLLLRSALLEWGVPERLVTDNGSDFVSREARRVFAALKIAHDPATPFSPWEKAFVERVIGTLQHGLFPMMPGYCGHNVAAAQQIRARRTFANRMGETEAEAFEVTLDARQVQVLINDWVSLVYHHREHAGLGRSPAEVLARSNDPIKRIDDERGLDMLLIRSAGERRVGKKGLRVNGRHYWDMDGRLLRWVGSPEPLEVRVDPDNISVAHVYRIDPHEFVCTARCLDLMPEHERAAVAVAARKGQAKALSDQRRTVKAGAPVLGRVHVLRAALENAQARHGASSIEHLPEITTEHSTPQLRIAAAAAAPKAPPQPLTAAEAQLQDRIVTLHRAATPAAPQSDEDRWWARAADIRDRMDAGEDVPPADAHWLQTIESRPWYRARAKFAMSAASRAG